MQIDSQDDSSTPNEQVFPAADHRPDRLTIRDIRQFRSWLTLLFCTICILVFFFVVTQPENASDELLALLVPDIWDSGYWGLITSTFVHIDLLHLIFNVYWLWHLGILLEARIGSLRWVIFFVSSALISSAYELAFLSSTGIGMSGVLYAMFGFMWITRVKYPEFSKLLTPKVSFLLLAWLVLCYVLTQLEIWRVGNAAHLAGLLFGAGTGLAFSLRKQQVLSLVAIGIMSAGAVLSIFWAPWSTHWVSLQAFKAHERQNYAAAAKWYRRSLELGQDPIWVWKNLTLLHYSAGNTTEYIQAFEELRKYSEKAADDIEKELIALAEQAAQQRNDTQPAAGATSKSE